MLGNNSDSDWEKFGKKEPYYWVTTMDKYQDDQLTEDRLAQFFSEGHGYAIKLIEIIRKHMDPSFFPTRVFDFGCGVGRITIPLARIAQRVVGMDISDSMLTEARKNATRKGFSNLSFVKGDDRLSRLDGTFNFIHSIYVFQHIPWSRGRVILQQLLQRLDDKGVISLQFLISNTLSRHQRLRYKMKVHIPMANNIFNLLARKKWDTPMMQLNSYDLNLVLEILRAGACHQLICRYTQESYYKGVIIIAQKRADRVPGFIDLGDIP